MFGGGTDYPAWYREHGGRVLSTAINKYCYISCRLLPPFFEHKHRIVYSAIEMVKSLDEIRHPAVRSVLKYFQVEDGLEIHHDGDLPARSGIGSSSAFTVGMINTLHALRGQMISKYDLARLAVHLEQNVMKEMVGSQDQIACAYGGINRIEFHKDDSFTVQPVVLHPDRREELRSHLMMFFTGFSRTAAEVAKTKVENFDKKSSHLRAIGTLVDDAIGLLQDSNRPITGIGKMLHEGWRMKRELSDKVSNSQIDDIYQTAMSAGAVGGKILGAGGGGFFLAFCEPEKQAKVREALRGLIEVKYDFDFGGSRITLYDPDMGGTERRAPRPLSPETYRMMLSAQT